MCKLSGVPLMLRGVLLAPGSEKSTHTHTLTSCCGQMGARVASREYQTIFGPQNRRQSADTADTRTFAYSGARTGTSVLCVCAHAYNVCVVARRARAHEKKQLEKSSAKLLVLDLRTVQRMRRQRRRQNAWRKLKYMHTHTHAHT